MSSATTGSSTPAYDKAAITTAPMHWRAGFHGRADFSYNLDPDLRLVHLHRMDYEICLQRHRSRENRGLGRARCRGALGAAQPDHRRGRVSSAGSTRTAASRAWRSTSRRSPRRGATSSEPAGARAPGAGPAPAGDARPGAPSRGDVGSRSVAAGTCSTQAVSEHIEALGAGRAHRRGDQRRGPGRPRLEAVRQPRLPRVRPLRPTGRPGRLRRRHLRAGDRARHRSVGGGQEPPRPLPPRRARDRLDAVPDPRPRAAGLRDARLLALHPPRPAHAAWRAPGLQVDSVGDRGAIAAACWPTSTPGRRTGAGIRCPTSPICPCRSGRLPGIRRELVPSRPAWRPRPRLQSADL